MAQEHDVVRPHEIEPAHAAYTFPYEAAEKKNLLDAAFV